MLLEFDKYIKNIDSLMKFIGMSVDKEDSGRTMLQRLKYHWKFSIHLIVAKISLFCQGTWLLLAIATGKSLLQITYAFPCFTFCLLGDIKICSYINQAHRVNDVIATLKNLQTTLRSNEEMVGDNFIKIWLKFLEKVEILLIILSFTAVFAFLTGPFVIMGFYYYTMGKAELLLPFLVWYPFDETQIQFWLIAFIQQFWAAWVAVFSVLGPDCFFFTCCTFIVIQFTSLQHEFEQIIQDNSRGLVNNTGNDAFKITFLKLVNRHRDLIRCVELIDIVYAKSTLINVISSSFIICATGFNLMFLKNYVLMAPFCSFLIFGMLQMLLYCYYGDSVMRSSMGVGDAIYNSRWYEAGATERRYLYFVLVRSQKPCKFAAYRFTDINLMAFTRILSTSWSYFALLNQIYQP